MGKKKHFDKHRSIVFKLVPVVDKNNESRIMFQPVVPKKCTLTDQQKEDIIKEFSNQHEFDVKNLEEHNEALDGIPLEILQKIRGRSDIVINGKAGKGSQVVMQEDDFFVEDVSDEQMMDNIEQEQDNYKDEEQGEQQQWQTDSEEQIEKEQKEEQIQEIKPNFINFQEDFPELPESGTLPVIQQTQKELSKLTKKQLQILNGILPPNYQSMKLTNANMKMFDEDGNPIDGYDYSQHYSKGGGHVIAKFQVDFVVPASPDIDFTAEQMPGQGKEVDEALEKADIYEPLEDNFFINLVKMDNVTIEEKVVKKKVVRQLEKKKEQKIIGRSKPVKQAIQKVEEQEQFTQEQLYEAMNQMRNNAVRSVHEQRTNNKASQLSKIELDGSQEEQDIQQNEDQDERQFHELNRKQKRDFMKNYKIPEVEDLSKAELKIKMKTFKGAKPEQIHLKTIHPKLPFSQDAAMQETIQKGSDTSSIQTLQYANDSDDDIVSYHTKHSTVSSSVNFIIDEGKKKENKTSHIAKVSDRVEIKKPEQPVAEKRNKQQTKEEKKFRKQQVKDFKKEKRESKKLYLQELKTQKKIVEGNSKAPLFKVPRFNII